MTGSMGRSFLCLVGLQRASEPLRYLIFAKKHRATKIQKTDLRFTGHGGAENNNPATATEARLQGMARSVSAPYRLPVTTVMVEINSEIAAPPVTSAGHGARRQPLRAKSVAAE